MSTAQSPPPPQRYIDMLKAQISEREARRQARVEARHRQLVLVGLLDEEIPGWRDLSRAHLGEAIVRLADPPTTQS